MVTPPESPQKECPFCQIARGEDPAALIVAEAESWVAFFPLEPAVLGHTLVIPREHVTDFWSSNEEINAVLSAAVVRVGAGIERELDPDGMNLITSAGAAAEQTVPHLHMHVLPRFKDDDFGPIWPAEGAVVSDTELSDLATRIGAQL